MLLAVSYRKDADACGFTYIPVSDWSQEAILRYASLGISRQLTDMSRRDAVVLDTKCFDGSSSFRSCTLVLS